jgi:hypothetical protein
MNLVNRLLNEEAIEFMLPLTAEGRSRISCHQVEEMDIDRLIYRINNISSGLIITESEDEACDVIGCLQKRLEGYHFEWAENSDGGFYVGYEKKQ